MHQIHDVVIPLDLFGHSNWTLHIRRENNSSHIYFDLHWGDKQIPTHSAVEPVKDFAKVIEQILKDQVST